MTCDFNGLRRNLADAYNRHVGIINALDVDVGLADTCAEIGNGIATLLALSSDDGIVDLSDEVTLRSPYEDD
jgi:hypothetical protein